jgi:RNA recognition motif-containing protein
MNIYVGNLPYSATEDEVRELFAAFGQVTTVTLITDKFSGQPRGFGFVEMQDDAEAEQAIQGLNGKEFGKRNLVVNPARPREERRPRRSSDASERRGPGGEQRDRRGSGRNRDEW